MSVNELKTIDKEITRIQAAIKRSDEIENRYSKLVNEQLSLQRELNNKITDLKNKRLVLAVPFKIGDIVQCYDPVGLYEIQTISLRCYAKTDNDYQIGAIKLTQSGYWGYCPKRVMLRPDNCKPWKRPPEKDAKTNGKK